jgi:putative oxidoreductase
LANIAIPSKSGSFDIDKSATINFVHFYFKKMPLATCFGRPPLRAVTEPRRFQMTTTRYLPFAGRLLIGLPFAMSGLGKLAAYSATVGMISAAGLPLPPLAFAVAVAVELGGGLLLVAGYRTQFVAGALAIFAIATAVSFHSNFADQNQMIHFLKNVMMAGGLLQIVAFGAGPLSIDNRRKAHRLSPQPAAA